MSISIKNRNDAYKSIIDKLPEKRKYIFSMIESSPDSTAWDIANKTLLPFNQVAARITELKEIFLVKETGSKVDGYTTKKNTTYQVITDHEERINLINNAFISLRTKRENLENDYSPSLSETTKIIIRKEIKKVKTLINSLSKISISYEFKK